LEPVVTDEEEVVRVLWYLGEVGVTDLRDVETKDVPENLWRYARDVQQRVSSPFESDDFRVQGQNGVEVDLAAGGLNSIRYRKNLEIYQPTLIPVLIFSSGDRLFITARKKAGVLMWGLATLCQLIFFRRGAFPRGSIARVAPIITKPTDCRRTQDASGKCSE
jgi:hypothetical protein